MGDMASEVIEISSDEEIVSPSVAIRSTIGPIRRRHSRRNISVQNSTMQNRPVNIGPMRQFLSQFNFVPRRSMRAQLVERNVFVVSFEDELQVNQTMCTICLEEWELDKPCVSLTCNHIFCKKCIVEWLKKHSNCPQCRRSVLVL